MGGTMFHEVDEVRIHDTDSKNPRVSFRHEGRELVCDCDFIAGCDGFHGVSRQSIPGSVLRENWRPEG